jgi:hypothetical protein
VKGASFAKQPLHGDLVNRETPALIDDWAVPMKIVGLERAQDIVCRSRDLAGRIDVLHPDAPHAARLASMNEARDGGREGSEV